MKIKIPEAFEEALTTQKRYAILRGGAGAGKSEFAARKIVIRCLQNKERVLVVRRYGTTLRHSVMDTIRNVLMDSGVNYIENKTDRIFYTRGSEILFIGLDDAEKLKSIKGVTSVWLEEASELAREDLMQIDLRLRGETPSYKQIMLTFNPVPRAYWIKDFADSKPDDEVYHRNYTVKDNPFIDREYVRMLEEVHDENYRRVYLLGEWGFVEEGIYTNYEVKALDFEPDYYGIDYGFNNPTALVGIKEDGDIAMVKELLYRKGMTQDDLTKWLVENIPLGSQIFADSAEPARIEDINRAGYTCIPADKRVKDGILYCKSKKLIIDGSNLEKEIAKYAWERKGDFIYDTPIKIDDHAIDAMRYGLYTKSRMGSWRPIEWD